MEPGSKLDLTLANKRITGSGGYSETVGGRLEVEVAAREGIHIGPNTRHLVAVKKIKCLTENLQVGSFPKAEATGNAQIHVDDPRLSEGVALELQWNTSQSTRARDATADGARPESADVCRVWYARLNQDYG